MQHMKSTEKRCNSVEETLALGESIGKLLRGGEIIELQGDVGAGKTTFVRGLAAGIGSKDHVSSPTLTVRNVYQGRITLHHLDLYRLHEPGLIEHELHEIIDQAHDSIVVEWAETLHDTLPEARVTLSFLAPEETLRVITVESPPELSYIEDAL